MKIAQHIMLIILCQHNMLCFLLTFIYGNAKLLVYGDFTDYVNQ